MQLFIRNTTNIEGLDSIIVPIVQNEKLSSVLENISQKTNIPVQFLTNDFKANHKEFLTLYDNKAQQKIYLLGLGDKLSFDKTLKAFRSIIFNLKNKLSEKIAIDCSFLAANDLSIIEAAVNGTLLGRYDIALYKTEKKERSLFFNGNAVIYVVSDNTSADLQNAVNKAKATAETQIKIYDLVNAPSNVKTPTYLSKWAEKSSKEFGFKSKAYFQKELEKMGCHALLSVSKGSQETPAMIVMEYKPKGIKNPKKVGLVGKGVTFDTGGISIKPSNNMHFMKSDMGGAAAVLGAVELCAKLELPIHLVGVVVSTENCVDGASTKPGDVINSYSGKTIEVIDTDAEGRLILADGLSYITKEHQPDVLIDLATLTGNCIAALGYQCAGLLSNNDALAAKITQVGENCGERLWRLPLWDVYKEDMTSDIADIKNLSGKPIAGAITAAKFLEVFTNEHSNWAHLDIAGVAFMDSEFSGMRSGTAFGVKLLTDLFSEI